uniref:Uncharacterized protein n=1 Tax=Anguilla anguilla TaxID=7936 RepID=A0A0E9VAA0_ANGAN
MSQCSHTSHFNMANTRSRFHSTFEWAPADYGGEEL